MRILVTGGAGFIGSNMVRLLLEKGESVRVLDNFETGKRDNLAEVAEGIELVEGDIRDEATVERCVAGATYGISTSGVAGPTGGAPDKPVGTVCIGLATPNTVKGFRYQFPYKDRLRNKKIFAMTALNMLRKELLK